MTDPARPSGGLVGPGGVEPPTSRLSGVRSNHLSYEPVSEVRDQVSEKFKPLEPAHTLKSFDIKSKYQASDGDIHLIPDT